MTSGERVNYIFAVIISLALHVLLLVLALPFGALNGNTDVDVFSNGLMDISTVSEVSTKQSEKPVIEPAPPKALPEKKEIVNEKIDIATQKTPKKEEKKDENPREKMVKPESTVSKETVEKTSGGSNDGKTNQPSTKSLGDGSGMFSHKGLLKLRAPKAVENEGIKGDVTLRIVIETNGSIRQIDVLKGAEDVRLNQTAINYVRREWVFKPNAQPYRVDAVFSFKDSGAALYSLSGAETIVDGGSGR